ncbi:MAG TPA: sulfatase [Actinomycetota bacterium]|nr:sulfatase [Actinomycetota bacterium]
MRRAIGLAAAVAALATLPPTGPAARAQTTPGPGRPNVLLIITDDQRIESMGPMRKTRAWFKRGGTEYANAFATTPLCCPSRASIFTGRYAHNHLVRTNADAAELAPRSTLAYYLRQDGYQTAIVGKYLNSWTGQPSHFEQWHTFENRSGYKNVPFNSNGVIHRVKRYSTDYLSSRARALVRGFESQDAKPWFMVVGTWAPHTPANAEKKYRRTKVGGWAGNPAVFEEDRSDKPSFVQDKEAVFKGGKKLRTRQLRTLKSVDDLVDRVFGTMSLMGETGDTLAFFVSDNGIAWAEHGMKTKATPYFPAVRVPMFARWPGHVPAGVQEAGLVANVDIAPTVLQAAGVAPDPAVPLDGRSLLSPFQRDRLLLEFQGGNNQPGVPTWAANLTADAQYVEYYDDATGAVSFREYYDLINDPYQLTNLLGDADPTNDPPPDEQTRLSLRLSRDRQCLGREGSQACP